MRIISLELSDFRNYASAKVNFGEGLNVLYGKNASGKTNMLESIYVCSVFSSPRTVKDKELVRIGQDKATIKLVLDKKYRKYTILFQIDSQGKKKVAVNGIPVMRAGELLGLLGVVFFSPDEMKLVKESPQERRRFMDIGLSQQQKNYFIALQRYNKTLKQKNNLLKEYRGRGNIGDMLDVWDMGLAKEGATIIVKRTEFVKTLRETAAKFHSAISSDSEKLTLEYESDIDVNCDVKDVEARLLSALSASRNKDLELGYCTVGPHRDDMRIEINGKDSRKFASQGQQRTVALAMKLGEVLIYKDEIGEPPVLLLDDVLSELDASRQKLLLDMTQGFQTVLTCTEFVPDVPATLIGITDGAVRSDR